MVISRNSLKSLSQMVKNRVTNSSSGIFFWCHKISNKRYCTCVSTSCLRKLPFCLQKNNCFAFCFWKSWLLSLGFNKLWTALKANIQSFAKYYSVITLLFIKWGGKEAFYIKTKTWNKPGKPALGPGGLLAFLEKKVLL